MAAPGHHLARPSTVLPPPLRGDGDWRPDQPSRRAAMDRLSLKLWLRMLSCTNAIKRELERRMRRQPGMTLACFDLMAQLAGRPQGMALADLAGAMMVDDANVADMLRTLAQRGWLECDADKRDPVTTRLSYAGERAFARLARRHARWIAECLCDVLAQDQEQLVLLLARVKQQLAPAGESAGRGER